jgi:glycosyltransferase involved in cell wall biosynthesis
MKTEIIFSHPAKQGTMYHRALAAQEAGLGITFLTGMYFGDGILAKSIESRVIPRFFSGLMRRRNQSGLASSNVRILPSSVMAECFFRPLGRIREWDTVHDISASNWLLRRHLPGRAVFYGVQGSSRRTLRAAQRMGLTTLYEVTVAAPGGRYVDARLEADTVRELECADYVLSLSEFTHDWLISLGVSRSRIVPFPVGSDTDLFSPSRQSPDRVFRLLFVGRVLERKGVDVLFRAWSRLALPDSELLLVGRATADDISRLSRIAANTKFTFAGFCPHYDLPRHYRSASAFVLPSYAEGDPNVVHEAISSGLPCIVSTAARSVVRDGIEGLVCEPGNVESLMDCIWRLYNDASLRRQMGERARRRAEEFSWPSFRRRLGGMFQALIRDEDLSKFLLDAPP